MLEKIKVKKQLALTYLDRCTVACSHCITNSAPGLKQRLPLETAKAMMTESRNGGYQSVNITGGEPFLAYQDLRQLIRHAKSLGQVISVTSNGFWARDLAKAKEKLIPLREDGLDQLCLSYDQPHRETGLAVEFLENGVQAAQMIGLPVAVWLTRFKRDRMTQQVRRRLRKYRIELRISDMVPLGRAKSLDKGLFPDTKKQDLSKGCQTYGFLVVAADGNSYACCNAAADANEDNPLRLGSILKKPFREVIREKEKSVIHQLISYFGPKTLYDLLPASVRSQIPTDLHPCAFCVKILNSRENVGLLLRELQRRNSGLDKKLELLELLKETASPEADGFCYNLPGAHA